MAALPKGPEPAAEATKRLTQIKSLARRFTGTQLIQETDATSVELRLLPKHIDRYTPDAGDRSDGAVFLLVNGRNPALVLLVETDGEKWQYGVGRLSLPSTLTLRLDGRKVWSEAQPVISWTSPYTASNRPVVVPQPEPAISLPGR
jgi:hypothetical protein